MAAATDEEVGKKMGDGEVDEGIGEGGDSGVLVIAGRDGWEWRRRHPGQLGSHFGFMFWASGMGCRS